MLDTLYVSGELINVEFAGEEHTLKVIADEDEATLIDETEGIKADGSLFEGGKSKASPFTKLLQARQRLALPVVRPRSARLVSPPVSMAPLRRTLVPPAACPPCQVDVRDDSPILGQTLGEANLRGLLGVRVVAVKRLPGAPDTTLSAVKLNAKSRLILDAPSNFTPSNKKLLDLFHNVEVIKEGRVKEFVIEVSVTARCSLLLLLPLRPRDQTHSRGGRPPW